MGDQAGGGVLRELSRLVRGAIRGEDIFGRYGGEEFLLVCPGVGQRGAIKLARRLRKLVGRQVFEVGGVPLRLTVSLGVAAFQGSRERWPQDMIAVTQERLEAAKRAGGDREVGG